MLLATPFGWLIARRAAPILSDICLGTVLIVAAGAIAWGWRLATFNAYYFFFGAIAVFAVPVSAAATWWLIARLRVARRPILAVGIMILCGIQLEMGIVVTLARFEGMGGPETTEAVPISLLRAIAQLPPDAKLAYACGSLDESSFFNSKLAGIDAHTGRRVVPLCFQADSFRQLYRPARSRAPSSWALLKQRSIRLRLPAHPLQRWRPS
jgi:hypothetical protein